MDSAASPDAVFKALKAFRKSTGRKEKTHDPT